MKRLIFAFVTLLSLNSCSVDDDTANTTYELAKITGNDLPENFVFGETYSIDVNYVLPSSCNSFAGIDARREGSSPEQRRRIYVGVLSLSNNNPNCDNSAPANESSSNFPISIDERDDYTFYFWTGIDSNDQPIYSEVVVPVLERDPSEN